MKEADPCITDRSICTVLGIVVQTCWDMPFPECYNVWSYFILQGDVHIVGPQCRWVETFLRIKIIIPNICIFICFLLCLWWFGLNALTTFKTSYFLSFSSLFYNLWHKTFADWRNVLHAWPQAVQRCNAKFALGNCSARFFSRTGLTITKNWKLLVPQI